MANNPDVNDKAEFEIERDMLLNMMMDWRECSEVASKLGNPFVHSHRTGYTRGNDTFTETNAIFHSFFEPKQHAEAIRSPSNEL